jgi:hypothetical protein
MKLGGSLVATLCLVVTSTSLAHQNAPAWTNAKAERVVLRDATVLLPPDQRAALRAELLALIPRFRTLESLAWEAGDDRAASRIHNYRYRYSTALKKVDGGLRVTETACRGSGTASRGNRFTHFACAVVSEQVEVPSVELVYGVEGALPALVEGKAHTFGPYEAQLVVHALTSSSIAYRQAGVATSR